MKRYQDNDTWECCAVLVINFVTVGRAGEAAFTSWKSTFYDREENALVLYSPMPKVLSAKHITLYNDALDFELDPYFHLALYWIMGGGSRHLSSTELPEENLHWIFPSMALKSSPCRVVNERLRGAILALPSEELSYDVNAFKRVGVSSIAFSGMYSLTSLRDGAVSLILNHPSLQGPMHGVCRSGHDHTNVCSVFEYFWASYVLQCQAGRALSGWGHAVVSHGQVPYASLKTIFETGSYVTELTMYNFILKLFDPLFDGFHPQSQYWIIMERCFTTFLMYYDSFQELVGNTHPVVQKVRTEALTCGIDSNLLRRWGKLLRSQWEIDKNIVSEPKLDQFDVATQLHKLHAMLQNISM